MVGDFGNKQQKATVTKEEDDTQSSRGNERRKKTTPAKALLIFIIRCRAIRPCWLGVGIFFKLKSLSGLGSQSSQLDSGLDVLSTCNPPD